MIRITKDRCGYTGYSCRGIPLLSAHLFLDAVLDCDLGQLSAHKFFGIYNIPAGVYASNTAGVSYFTDEIVGDLVTRIVGEDTGTSPICVNPSQVFLSGLFDLASYILSVAATSSDLYEDVITIRCFLLGSTHTDYTNGFLEPLPLSVTPPLVYIQVETKILDTLLDPLLQLDSLTAATYMASMAAVAAGNAGAGPIKAPTTGCTQFAITASPGSEYNTCTINVTAGNIEASFASGTTLASVAALSSASFSFTKNADDATEVGIYCIVVTGVANVLAPLWAEGLKYTVFAQLYCIYDSSVLSSSSSSAASSLSAAVSACKNKLGNSIVNIKAHAYRIGSVNIAYTDMNKAMLNWFNDTEVASGWLRWDSKNPLTYTLPVMPSGFPTAGTSVQVNQQLCGPLILDNVSETTNANATTTLIAKVGDRIVLFLISNVAPVSEAETESQEITNYSIAGISDYGIRPLIATPSAGNTSSTKYALVWDGTEFTWLPISVCLSSTTS